MKKCKFCGSESTDNNGSCPACGANSFTYFYPVSKKIYPSKVFERTIIAVAITALFVLCMSVMDIAHDDNTDNTVSVFQSTARHAVSSPEPSAISPSDAVNIALNDAELFREQTDNLKFKLKNKNNRQYYRVSFKHKHTKYTYCIDPANGYILKKTNDKD